MKLLKLVHQLISRALTVRWWATVCPSSCAKEAGAAERAPKAPVVGRMFTSHGLALPSTDISSTLESNMDLWHGKKGIRGRKPRWFGMAQLDADVLILYPCGLVKWLLNITFCSTYFCCRGGCLEHSCRNVPFSHCWLWWHGSVSCIFLSKTTEMVKLISGQWLELSYNKLTQAQCN